MTTITQTPSALAGISTQVAENAQPSDAGSVLSSDFETFLKMLTAQAKYQDPLEPIDSSEYAAQMAQFSMVEQQVKGNELLTSLSNQMGLSNMTSMGSWIGMEVRSAAPVKFNGSPVTLLPNPPVAAQEVYLVVKNAEGIEVQRQLVPNNPEPIEWAGVNDNQTPFETGFYSFELEAFGNNSLISSTPVESYSRISEVRNDGGATMLMSQGGSVILPGEVIAIREAT